MAKSHASDTPHDEQPKATPEAKPHCGIIMPLSDTDGYPSGHWTQVQKLIIRAAEKADFTASMVSENLAEDMIHASIVRNIYHNAVVVCDVSSLNPNVMLELGMRMSTLLPLILVFDGEIKYPFDINSILHVRYPKGLNIFRMEDFVEELSVKIRKVHDAQQKKEYQPFLSHFKEVTIEPAKLEHSTQSVSEAMQNIVNEIYSVKREIKLMRDVKKEDDRNYLTEGKLSNRITDREKSFVDEIVFGSSLKKDTPWVVIREIEKDICDLLVQELYPGHTDSSKEYRKKVVEEYVTEKVRSKLMKNE